MTKQNYVHIMYIMHIFSIIGLIGIISIGYNDSASALTYQSSVTNSFTIESSVGISLSSSELTIDNLTPGQSADSNIITITTESNAGKFTLNSTVGNSTYDTTDLVQPDVEDSFSILSSSGDLDFGKWGFSFATEGSGDNWTNWSPYNGLPKYDNESTDPVNLVTDANAKTTIAFKIGAKASTSQAAGEYNNVINFIATASPAPKSICDTETCMQDMTMSECLARASDQAILVYDSRDENGYTVRYTNDACVMTQNLRFVGNKLTVDDSDVASEKDIIMYSLDSSDQSYSEHCDSINGYEYACIKYNDNEPYGAYYNYVAATAGNISGQDNATKASESICPKNWTLPEGYTTTGIAATFVSAGYYRNGSLGSADDYGYWWTSVARDDGYENGNTRRILFGWHGSFWTANNNRTDGISMRCSLKESS